MNIKKAHKLFNMSCYKQIGMALDKTLGNIDLLVQFGHKKRNKFVLQIIKQ